MSLPPERLTVPVSYSAQSGFGPLWQPGGPARISWLTTSGSRAAPPSATRSRAATKPGAYGRNVLGQSFGGFCAVTYLSLAPEGLREAFITGGLPGLDVTADDVYRVAYPRVAAKNAGHYERYPGDVARARRIARHLRAHDVRLPGGGPLTVENFQVLGRILGMSTGSHTLHYLLEDAFAGGELSDVFLRGAESQLTFAAGPLYAILHEACYAQGFATRWSAQRVRSGGGARRRRAAAVHRRDDLPVDDRG